MESILAATAGVAKLFMREHELGKILPGFLADCILVDGDPLRDVAILQDRSKLSAIMINGRFHKAPASAPSSDNFSHTGGSHDMHPHRPMNIQMQLFSDELQHRTAADEPA